MMPKISGILAFDWGQDLKYTRRVKNTRIIGTFYLSLVIKIRIRINMITPHVLWTKKDPELSATLSPPDKN